MWLSYRCMLMYQRFTTSAAARTSLRRFCRCSAEIKEPASCRTDKEVSFLLAALKPCTSPRDLHRVKKIHANAKETGKEWDDYVTSALIHAYVKCGSLEDARRLFYEMPGQNVVACNALMLGYVENGRERLALELFGSMQKQGYDPNARTFLAALKACAGLAAQEEFKVEMLETGMAIHSQAVRTGYERDIFLSSTLVDLYAKCGSLVDARAVFDRMPLHNVVSWTSLLLGYIENGKDELALDLFPHMIRQGCAPNDRTYVAALKACAGAAEKEEGTEVDGKLVKLGCLERGIAIHAQAAEAGFDSDIFVSNTLMDMYAKCGSMVDARMVFDRMLAHTLVSWSALMLGYVENGEPEVTLAIFFRLCSQENVIEPLIFIAALKACASLAAANEDGNRIDRNPVKVASLEKGSAVEAQAAKNGCKRDILYMNTLMNLYSKCGCMEFARRVFEGMPCHSVTTWTVLILGYAENGDEEVALELCTRMRAEGFPADTRTYLAAFKACISLAEKETAKNVDGKAVKLRGLEIAMALHSQAAAANSQDLNVVNVGSLLVDMYAKCGSMVDARGAFDRMSYRNAVSWNALILGYAESGEANLALDLFSCMLPQGILPNRLSYVAAMKACTKLASKEEGGIEVERRVVKVKSLECGRKIHLEVAACRYDESDLLVGNTLLAMYAECGSPEDAQSVFDRMNRHNLAAWTSLMLAYTQSGKEQIALELFNRMHTVQGGLQLDAPSFSVAIKACANLAALQTGKSIHAEICTLGLGAEESLAHSLLDLYGKCGYMAAAQHIFDSLPVNQECSWTALIAGYSRQGDSSRVFDSFNRMIDEGCQPDRVTFLCVMTACSHAGLLDRGQRYFGEMLSSYGVAPSLEHYICMVDILGRANELEAAVEVVNAMPFEPNAAVWTSILSACHKWKNIEVAKVAFQALVRLDHGDSSAYVMMSNIYRDHAHS